MKNIKPSPLKQLGNTRQEQGQHQIQQNKGMMEAGMDILSEAKRRKNWEEIQQDALAIEPQSTQIRKAKDKILMENQKSILGRKGIIEEPGLEGVGNADKYKASLFAQLKQMNDAMYKAIENKDEEAKSAINAALADMKTGMTRFREETQMFYKDHFSPDSFLSKSCSQQQLSFGTQIYCINPDLKMVHATELDVLQGETDAYGKAVVENHCYAIVENFQGQHVMVNVIHGNKNTYWIDANRAMEYIGFIKEYTNKATEARESKSVQKIDLGGINYKIDLFFGSNDGTATKTQDMLVLQFTWDTHLLRDGSSFRRHLYEHPNIENLNYGGFDYETMKFKTDLGPEDKNYWYDKISPMDKLQLVDAICNVDNPFFDIKLLRTLVKEYYTYRIENAWWKSMGYEEGRLQIMRLKQNELTKQRFEMAKAKASKDGLMKFVFDGEVHKTGLTKAKIKKQEEEKQKISEENNPDLKKK